MLRKLELDIQIAKQGSRQSTTSQKKKVFFFSIPPRGREKKKKNVACPSWRWLCALLNLCLAGRHHSWPPRNNACALWPKAKKRRAQTVSQARFWESEKKKRRIRFDTRRLHGVHTDSQKFTALVCFFCCCWLELFKADTMTEKKKEKKTYMYNKQQRRTNQSKDKRQRGSVLDAHPH